MTKGFAAIFLIAAMSAAVPARADADVKAGQVLFQERCVACHAAQPTRQASAAAGGGSMGGGPERRRITPIRLRSGTPL